MRKKKLPRKLLHSIGAVCRAGQHENCCAVSDPYDGETRDVWVCACECHR